MDLRRSVQSVHKIADQEHRGARGGDQLREEDGREVDDRPVAVADQLDKGIPHRRAVLDTCVQANLQQLAERKAKVPLLSRDERIYRLWNSYHRYTGECVV